MLAVTTETIPCAVSITPMPSVAASRPIGVTRQVLPHRASARPAGTPGFSVCNTTFASVTVGSVLPRP